VLAELERHGREPAQTLADAVTAAALTGRRTTDDVCVLALRWTGNAGQEGRAP
jgi:hypothetical protein